jgi:hypothetical protein
LKFISIAMQVSSLPNRMLAMPRKTVMKVKHNYFSPPRSHRPLITVPPALTGAARSPIANPLTFIASGAAVAFWFFFATEKELGPRGYERNEIRYAW